MKKLHMTIHLLLKLIQILIGSYSPIRSKEYITYEDAGIHTTTKYTSTNTSGTYEALIPLTRYEVTEGYSKGFYHEYIKDFKVEFSYNGVEYITCESKKYRHPSSGNLTYNYNYASEQGRINFNKRFQTIKEITDTNLYDAYGSWNKANMKSEPVIGIHYPYNSKTVVDGSAKRDYYEMNADTGNCETEFNVNSSSQVINNVNIGLNHRFIDLALTMNVDHTDVSINGKTTTYDYTDININTNEELEKWINSVLSNNSVNVDVYPSDYYYRIADYANGGMSNILKDDSMTKDYAKSMEDELDIKITYKVRMFNQTAGTNANIKELVYYYDKNAYTIYSVSNKPDGTGTRYKWSNANSNYGTIDGYNGIVIIGNWNVSSSEQYLYLTFTLNKDNVKKDLDDKKQAVVNGNIVAITSYSTNDGLLDRDSSTRSIVSGSDIQYEDDTSRAENVNINISSKIRKISGNVFNDLDKAGILNDGEAINDVVVQLIEITKNNNEYIWQETKAGSKEVTSLVRLKEGDLSAYNYNNTVGNNETGKYEFLNIVPGNYIVRFIYGDGYNYDIAVVNTTYNGADYKSTIDPKYNSEWFNTATYSANASVARDNEARRLEVMQTTSTIDSGVGTALEVYSKNKNSITQLEKANILSYLTKLNEKDDNEFNAALNYLKTSKGNNDSWSTWKNNVLSNISDQDLLVLVKKFVAYKTFMTAETSKINVPVDVSNNNALKTDKASITIRTTRNNNDYKIVNYNIDEVSFANVNFGITLRPQVKLELEKHITALKITPNGNGVAPIIDAKANIQNIVNGNEVVTTGEQKGLTKVKSTRAERGWWKVETEVELDQGANLEVEYTYVVKNVGDEDYISSDLAELYTSNSSEYSINLKKVIDELKPTIKGKTHTYGNVLGKYYYTGIKENTDVAVTSRAELFGEALNNQLRYEKEISGSDFNKVNSEVVGKTIYDVDGIAKEESIDTIVETTNPSSFLTKGKADISKKLKLTKVLPSLNSDDNGNIPSYIAEVLKYSSASGGRNREAVPGNLSYVHSKDGDMTLDNSYIYEVDGKMYEAQDENMIPEGATNIRKANENDEFWGETIMIGKRTGENKILPVQIGIVVVASVAVIGVGIVLIKKFILAK